MVTSLYWFRVHILIFLEGDINHQALLLSNHSPACNFTPTVTQFCVKWEGLSLPHDTKFGNCRCKIVDSRVFPIWSLIHGSGWSGLIKAEPGACFNIKMPSDQCRKSHCVCGDKTIIRSSYLHNGIYYTGETASSYQGWSLLRMYC